MEQRTGWSKELLHQLVDTVKEYAIFACDVGGVVVGWNIGAHAIFGYEADEIIGQSSDILFTPDDRLIGIPEHERSTAAETGWASDERWHVRKDGSLFFASGIQTALRDDRGELTGFAKIARDLTERVELKNQLSSAAETLEVKVVERTSELSQWNENLRREVSERKRSEEVRLALLRKIVAAQEGERKRVARDIHDHIGQQIIALKLKLNVIAAGHSVTEEFAKEIAEAQAMATRIDDEADFLAWELRPSLLDDLGLPHAARKYVRDWAIHFQVQAEFREVGVGNERLVPEVEINLYRIIQEALNNTAKHAEASRASVLLEKSRTSVRLIVEDDGAGFEAERWGINRYSHNGLGLLGMKERAELLGGKIEIESKPGTGTTIFVRVPVEAEAGGHAAVRGMA